MLDNLLWSALLPTLIGLRISAEQPVEASSYHGAPLLSRRLIAGSNGSSSFCNALVNISREKPLSQVDFNGRAETRELVKECLPHGHRAIR